MDIDLQLKPRLPVMVPPMLLTLWELPDLPPLLFQLLLEVVLELANMLPTQLELFTLPSVKLKVEPEAKADAGLLYGGYGHDHLKEHSQKNKTTL